MMDKSEVSVEDEDPEFYYVRTCGPSGQYFVACYDPDRSGYYCVKVDGFDKVTPGCCLSKNTEAAYLAIHELTDCPEDYETAIVPYYKRITDPEIIHEKVKSKKNSRAL